MDRGNGNGDGVFFSPLRGLAVILLFAGCFCACDVPMTL